MATIQPVQNVESEGEKVALLIAQMLEDGKRPQAQSFLLDFSDTKKLALWEIYAIADMATRMQLGKPWKKG